ncbi:methyl-accepting chemotaxis protein [Psychromonas sp. SR45-3]|uniref:methyl-accepting chemotaxis protein n=1 Tax=Psychromonas sp. SR45-3 TaxID=2760930 RepID=UPI0015FE3B09|nr:methyl-accepting chemotaxis protein [Psychromonas sp. SR45-3]MBB1271410.1 methyl-accepting chemotaxis protein [Psychromonas sp. SR45-3]
MAQVQLNSLEKKLVNTSSLTKGLILFFLGALFILVINQFFVVNLVATFIVVFLLVLVVVWQHYCNHKQLAVLQQYLQDPSTSKPEQLEGAFSQLYLVANSQIEEATKYSESAAGTLTQLHEVTEQFGACMEVINESVAEEFEQIELLATAMNQMTTAVKEVEGNAESASTSTLEATNVAEEGRSAVDATITSINSLSKNIDDSAIAVNNVESKVESIGSVVDTIRSISDQTNLLALNAAIEAARAGEYGRGFAVVADEVRSLAKRTQDATVEIQAMIEQLQKSAQQAVGLMDSSVKEAEIGVKEVTKAGIKLSDIVGKVNHISELNYQIASAAKDQATVAEEINNSLVQVKETVEGSVVVLKEVTDMTKEIYGYTVLLTKV